MKFIYFLNDIILNVNSFLVMTVNICYEKITFLYDIIIGSLRHSNRGINVVSGRYSWKNWSPDYFRLSRSFPKLSEIKKLLKNNPMRETCSQSYSGEMDLAASYALSRSVESIHGVGPKIATLLHKKNIHTVEDWRPRNKSRGDSGGVGQIFNRRFKDIIESAPRAHKTLFDVCRGKAAIFSGWNSHPASVVPAGSNWNSDGGNEVTEASSAKDIWHYLFNTT